MKETDLYPPVKRFLESQGYEVKGEVNDCDVVALRGGDAPLVVELKLSLNLDLILQGVARLALTDAVYIGIPPLKTLVKRKKQLLKTLRMLGLGLLVIHSGKSGGRVDVLLDPGPYQPRQSAPRKSRLLGEFARRVGDPNPGGDVKRGGIMTAYRQQVVAIAEYLVKNGPGKASAIAQTLEIPGARDILYRDYYGWFERVERGVYALSPRGNRELKHWLGKQG